MKLLPQEEKLRERFDPGKLSRDGFLGDDTRHIHDIIQADGRILSCLGVNREGIADRLQDFIEEGKKGLETTVDLGEYTVQVRWQRGMIPCPFGERGLHHKIIATVFHKKLGKTFRFSQLNVHMIREHGFFEGKGSLFRLEPRELVRYLDIQTDADKK